MRTASAAVKQPAVLGSTPDAAGPQHVEDPAARRGVDAPQRHRGERRARGLHDGVEDVEARDPAGAEHEARAPGCGPAMTKSVGSPSIVSLPPPRSRSRRRRRADSVGAWATRCGARPRGCGPRRCRRATRTTSDTRSATVAPGATTRAAPFTTTCGSSGSLSRSAVTHGASMAPRSRAGARRAVTKRPGPNGAISAGGSSPGDDGGHGRRR